MRVYVPGRVPPSPRERRRLRLRFAAQCIGMTIAGFGAVSLILTFAFAVSASGELVTAALGGG